jgi:hypothetical protein
MKTALFTLLSLTLAITTGQAAKVDKINISKDSKFVAHLDLDAFRASEIGTTMLKRMRQEEGKEKLDALIEIIGFDPLTAIQSATLSGNGEEDNAILVVRHKGDSTKLLAFMKLHEHYRKTEHGKHEIHGAGDRRDGERGYVSFVNDTTAVMVPSRELAAKAIELVNGKGAATQVPPSLDMISKEAKSVFLMAYADVESLKEHIDDVNVSQMAKKATLVLGGSDGNLVLSLAVDAYSADTAEQMEAMVNGLIGFARLGQEENPEIKDILKGMKVTRNEATVSIHFAMGMNKFLELIDPALKEIDIDLP